MFNELVSYCDEHGSGTYPQAVSGKLGRWVMAQRAAYKKNNITRYRIKKLNSINFYWNAQESNWQNKLQELIEYSKIHGRGTYPSCTDGTLGRWCNKQREMNVSGKITGERKAKLDEIGFTWNPPYGASSIRENLRKKGLFK